jgi:SAM-dependent methyltransferase
MVEIGHGRSPVAYQQPTGFTGQRSYVGIEAGLRDLHGDLWTDLEKLRAEHPDQNVTFIPQSVGRNGEMRRRSVFSLVGRIFYLGAYNPRTDLEDGSADEVFLNNVFGDPHLALSGKRTRSLIEEASRLAADDGIIVVRESMTPHWSQWRLNDRLLASVGLARVQDYTYFDPEWRQLEGRYKNKRLPSARRDFYRFLAKTVAS